MDTAAHPPCPTPFNMAAYVLRHAVRLADKTALEIVSEHDAERYSYADLHRRVLRTANGFYAAGLRQGDCLLMRLGNRLEFPVAYLAAIYLGVIPVPSSAQLTTGEITKLAVRLRVDAILAEPGIALPDPLPCPVITLKQMQGFDDATPLPAVLGDPNAHAYTIFTSGTSGHPQGVRHAHRAIWARQMMHVDWYGMSETDRVMHAGAFNWTYTLGTGLMDPWSLGATALIPASTVSSGALPELLAQHRASIFAAAPGVYRQMLKSLLPPLANLRHGLSAGERLPESLRARWQKAAGCDLHEALGMSECSTFISGSPARPAPEGASGFAQTGRRIAVLDEHGAVVARETPGLLAISRDDPGLMLGYLDGQAMDREWFVTGDRVVMGADGAIRYLARADDVMTAGGFRIAPSEVEGAFDGIAGLDETAATQVQIKAETSGIALFYTASGPINEQSLRAHAQEKLAPYKQPHLYIQLDALPKGANGKLNRRALVALYGSDT